MSQPLSDSEYAAKLEQAIPVGIVSRIAVLKQDLPTLFDQDISYDIYSQDIFFAIR